MNKLLLIAINFSFSLTKNYRNRPKYKKLLVSMKAFFLWIYLLNENDYF